MRRGIALVAALLPAMLAGACDRSAKELAQCRTELMGLRTEIVQVRTERDGAQSRLNEMTVQSAQCLAQLAVARSAQVPKFPGGEEEAPAVPAPAPPAK